MKQTTIKPSEIASVYAWGGNKLFLLGPITLVISAGTEQENKYSVSCQLRMDDVTKDLFSFDCVLTKEEYEIADKRFAV